jgi:hypothetical protein
MILGQWYNNRFIYSWIAKYEATTHHEDVVAKFHHACIHRLKFVDLLLHNNQSL